MSKPQETFPTVVSTPVAMMRPATYSEITAFLRDREAHAEWEAVCDFAHQLFGERAHHVQVVTGDEYDDEHYYTVVENVIVYDADNNPLPYNLTLPYWSRVEPNPAANATSILQDFENSLKEEEAQQATTLLSQEERAQRLQDYAHEYVEENNLYENEFDLPRENATFALGEPPPEIADPALYILEAMQQSVLEQAVTPVAFVFHMLWDDPDLRHLILENIRYERSREASMHDMIDIVEQVLLDARSADLQLINSHELDLAPVIQFLSAYVGKVSLDPEYLEQNGFDPKLLEPKVTASCYSDDHMVEVKEFDATLWFAQASDEELRALRNEGCGGNYTADSVAECIAGYDPQVQAMFDHNDTLPNSVELRGFECHVNEKEAEVWIAQHRPHLLTEEEKENNNK